MAAGTVTKTKQRRIAILTTLALGVSLLGLSMRIPAQALGASTFNVLDGNETVDPPVLPATIQERDWLSPLPANFVTTKTDVASGSSDTSLSAAEDDTSPTFTTGSVQPNKSDLTKIRVAQEKVGSQDFLYLAWDRVPDGSGVMAIDFELNKVAQPALPTTVGQPWNLSRSPGDLLLTFELVNGGNTPIISLRKWLTTGTDPCQSGSSKPCWGEALVLNSTTTSPKAEGSVNAVPISFGEMAIDLGLTGIFTPGQCTSFASLYAKSRSSGSSFSNQISDLVAPVTTTVTNCGSLTVAKAVAGPTIAGDQTSFGFSVSCDLLLVPVDMDSSTAGIQTARTFSLLAGASLKISDIPVGSNCTVTETQPLPVTNWTVTHNATATSSANVAAVNNIPLAGSSVTFTNTRNSGAMNVSKTSTGGTGSFTFVVDCNDGTAHDRTGTNKIVLTTTAAGTTVTSSDITGIPTGTVCTVTEESNVFYTPSSSPASSQVTIDADTATTQTVAYTNVRKTATLTVDKLTTGGTGTFLFAVDCNDGTIHDRSGTSKLSIMTTGTDTVTGIPTGTSCLVTEDLDPDFNSSLRSPSTSNTVVIADTGSTVYFQNTRKTGTLTVVKTSTGGAGNEVFTFEVDCTDNRFDRSVAGRNALTITYAGSATVTGIPTGTSCVVTEVNNSQFTSIRTPTNGTVIMDENGETVTFSNDRNMGTITVSKTTTGGTGTFKFNVVCSDTAFNQQLTIINTNTATTSPIPTDTTCTVDEVVNPDFNSARTSISGPVTVTSGTQTVSFTNTRKVGSLKIDKTTTGGTGTFLFSVDCDGTAYDRTGLNGTTKVSITNSGFQTLGNIPTGTQCTVTEDANAFFTSTITSASNTVTITDTAIATVSFLNERKVATLTVNKVTTGGTGTFLFVVDCNDGTTHDRDGNNKLSITTSGSATVTGIPTATSCVVTEDADPLYTSTADPTNGTVTITDTGAHVDFTNTRKVAGLTINKATSGGTGTFLFSVDCDGTAYDRTGSNGTTKVSIVNSGTATLANIPTGTRCVVLEDLDPLFTSTSTPANGTVIIPDGGTHVDFTNVRKTGTLTVSKVTTGGTGTFRFEVDCTDDRFDRLGVDRLTITNSGTATITGIPTTVVCTVTETVDAAFASTRTPANGLVTISENANTVSFTNVRKTGTLTVAKTTTGGTGTFLFAVDCTDDAFDRLGAAKLSITGSGTATVTGIPTDTSCTVTEDADPLFTSTRTPTNGTVVMDTNGKTVSFTNDRNTGSLTIAKSTAGGDGTFAFAVDCTDDRFDRASVSVATTSGAGSSNAIAGIPTTTSCTVTETVPAGWAAVGATSKTTTIAGNETVSFTNRKLPSSISIAKTPSALTVHAGEAVTYSYTVTNTGENPLTSVVVVDDKCAPLTFAGGDTDGDKALDLAESWTFTCTSVLTATTTNIATATGTDPHNATVKATANATVIVIKPAIAIAKTPSSNSVEPGATVVYTYTVTNPGDVPLSAVVVSDDKCSPVTFVKGDLNTDKLLQPGEIWIFQCSQVQTGRIDTLTNIGTATGVDALNLKVSATDKVTVSVVAPAVITRPAPEVVAPAPIQAAPAVIQTLPRTGSDLKGWLQLAGSLILLGLALVLSAGPLTRRRFARQ